MKKHGLRGNVQRFQNYCDIICIYGVGDRRRKPEALVGMFAAYTPPSYITTVVMKALSE